MFDLYVDENSRKSFRCPYKDCRQDIRKMKIVFSVEADLEESSFEDGSSFLYTVQNSKPYIVCNCGAIFSNAFDFYSYSGEYWEVDIRYE
jgi:hypothetical protein